MTTTSRGAQGSKVLEHFRRGERLTQLDALRLYGVGRLAAVVFDLKRAGHDIRSEMVGVEKANGSTARVATYWMSLAAPVGLFGDVAAPSHEDH